MNETRLEELTNQLNEQITSLKEEVKKASDVRDELIALRKRGLVNLILIALLGVVTVGLVIVGVQAFRNTEALSNVITVQHDQALCPLYQLFKNSNTPQARENALKRGDDMVIRDRSFATIDRSYEILGCQQNPGK